MDNLWTCSYGSSNVCIFCKYEIFYPIYWLSRDRSRCWTDWSIDCRTDSNSVVWCLIVRRSSCALRKRLISKHSYTNSSPKWRASRINHYITEQYVERDVSDSLRARYIGTCHYMTVYWWLYKEISTISVVMVSDSDGSVCTYRLCIDEKVSLAGDVVSDHYRDDVIWCCDPSVSVLIVYVS